MNLLKQEPALTADNTRLIPLTQGQFAIVDSVDYDWLNQWRWYAGRIKKFYAMRKSRGTTVFMHREILGLAASDERMADHIDRNTLNNKRSNLRVATASQNAQNKAVRSDSTSSIKGIYYLKSRSKWRVTIGVKRRYVYIGLYATKTEAATAYRKASQLYHGEFGHF